MPTSAKHPKGFISVVFINFAEHFSYNSLMALFVLYLTELFIYENSTAIYTQNSFITMAFIIPIIAGWIADRYLGYFTTVMLGMVLCVIGLLTLGYGTETVQLYALCLLLVGFSLQKSNIQCLLGSIYHTDSNLRDAGFTILQITGNIGGIIGPLACGYIGLYYSYAWSFNLAATPYIISIILLVINIKTINTPRETKKIGGSHLLTWLSIILILSLIIIVSAFLIQNAYAHDLLFIIIGFASIFFLKLYFTSNKVTHNQINMMLILMIFACIYWASNGQLSSSLMIYVQENVNLRLFDWLTIPPSAILSCQQASMLIFGLLIAYWYKKHVHEITNINRLNKATAALFLQMTGFIIISLCTHYSFNGADPIPILWIILAVIITGLAEIIYMPTAMSLITQIGGGKHSGFLTAYFLLFSGALPAYVSTLLIKTASSYQYTNVSHRIAQAHQYFHLYLMITLMCLISVAVLFSISILFKWKK